MSETAIDYGSRTLPHDDVAEQSVLGGMMLSKDAIADVVETLHAGDFYKPQHELIYEAIISLYGHGNPADAITVADELKGRGELTRVGGQHICIRLSLRFQPLRMPSIMLRSSRNTRSCAVW